MRKGNEPSAAQVSTRKHLGDEELPGVNPAEPAQRVALVAFGLGQGHSVVGWAAIKHSSNVWILTSGLICVLDARVADES